MRFTILAVLLPLNFQATVRAPSPRLAWGRRRLPSVAGRIDLPIGTEVVSSIVWFRLQPFKLSKAYSKIGTGE